MTARSIPHAAQPSLCRLVVAVLVLVARLLGAGPDAQAHAASAGAGGLDGTAICWGGGAPAGPHAPPAPHHGHDCLLCPACHLAAPAVLPTPVPAVPLPVSVSIQHAPLAPPATGPPGAAWIAPPPTGPPTSPA